MTCINTNNTLLPEPLLAFAPAAGSLISELRRIDALLSQYQKLSKNGGILLNTTEALRIEYTYHSNAIEGCTLTLRETQLIIEGQTPPGGKPMREVYEARNHDRAVRMIEMWAESDGSPAHSLDERAMLDLHAEVLADIAPGDAGVLMREPRYWHLLAY